MRGFAPEQQRPDFVVVRVDDCDGTVDRLMQADVSANVDAGIPTVFGWFVDEPESRYLISLSKMISNPLLKPMPSPVFEPRDSALYNADTVVPVGVTAPIAIPIRS
jgi:hypothetical protein